MQDEMFELGFAVIGIVVVIVFLVLMAKFQEECQASDGYVVKGITYQCVKDGKVIEP